MNRRHMMMLSGAALAQAAPAPQTPAQASPDAGPDTPDKFLLKDYRPQSIYRVPKSEISRAKFPVFDVHCHGARPIDQLGQMVRLMDAAGVEKTVIFTGAGAADRFAESAKPYAQYPNRFDLWCSFDMTGTDQPGFGPGAVKALEACHAAGALGVGEMSDKGWGFGARGAGGGRGGAGRGTAPPTPGPASGRPIAWTALRAMRAVGHAAQHSHVRSDLVLPADGSDQRRPDERLHLEIEDEQPACWGITS